MHDRPPPSPSRHRRRLAALTLAGAACSALLAPAAQAGITFQMDRAHASPGESLNIVAIFFNDGQNLANWSVPASLVLQWRDAQGNSLRSLADMQGGPVALQVPVNNFARVSWRAVVPRQVSGLQAVAIEGESVMMALDTSTRERGTIAGGPASGPVIDAESGAPVPAATITSLGLSASQGPPVADAMAQSSLNYRDSTLDHFRNALSVHDPVYLSMGTRGGLNAKFQISFKYRFFQPDESRAPRFYENIYLGYTQTSLWDLDSPSKPFYDTSYRPSLFWQSDQVWASPTKRWSLGMTSGLEHESNGKDGDASRSLNYAYIEPALRYRLEGGSTLSFAPKIKGYFSTHENSDIRDYRGIVDWKLSWEQDDGMMLAAWLRRGKGKGSTQIDFAYPLRDTWLSNLNGYLHMQYFNGYGESLLDYDVRREAQFRIGLMLVR